MKQFNKILGTLELLTPASFLQGLRDYEMNTELHKGNYTNFMNQTPVSAALFSQMTWAGKLAASKVIQSLCMNKDNDFPN